MAYLVDQSDNILVDGSGTDHGLVNTGAASPVFNLTASPNPSVVGSTITFTASDLTDVPTPTGTVTFVANGITLGTQTLVAGSAVQTTSSLAIGIYTITATYNGDANYGSVAVNLTQIVNPVPSGGFRGMSRIR